MTMFGKDKEEINGKLWDWATFTTTEGYPISENLLDWVVGQDKAMLECKLCIDEWIHKLKGLKKKQWWKVFENPEGYKPQPKEMMPAGPFLFMAGDAGTGKSLIGRALAGYMTDLYKKHNLSLHDVLCWSNKVVPSNPRISIHEAGNGSSVIKKSSLKGRKKSWLGKWGLRIFCGFLAGLGITLLGLGFYGAWQLTQMGMNFTSAIAYNAPLLAIGGSMATGGLLVMIFSRVLGNLGGFQTQGIGGASNAQSPKMIVDNSPKRAPFIDATGHTQAQLFGDITWDPYQSGGLGTPEHQRVNAGDVHRAHMGILFIDEIKNLVGPEAVTLLTVLEDGQMPITHRGRHGETGAMMVATEPVPAMCFLVAAGNFDSLPLIHFALMDRIYGYGKVVRMNNEMDNNVKNRRKVVQFIAQEVKRFNLLPFSKEACEEIVNESRRKTGFKNKLSTKFRPLIAIIKTSSVLAMNEGLKIVEKKHVVESVEEHCKTIHRQLLDYNIEKQEYFKYINIDAKPRIGTIAGLAVSQFGDDFVGQVFLIKASMEQAKPKSSKYFMTSGVKKRDETHIADSVKKVRHVIATKFGVDPADQKTMIDFQQIHGVDGPSAGIAMTLALASIIKKKKIRQDVAVTGEITIDATGNIIVCPIGGVDAKIRAAQQWGYKRVIIPKRNFEHSINSKDYEIEIVGAETLEDYMKEVFE